MDCGIGLLKNDSPNALENVLFCVVVLAGYKPHFFHIPSADQLYRQQYDVAHWLCHKGNIA